MRSIALTAAMMCASATSTFSPAPPHLKGVVDLTIGGSAESRDEYTVDDVRGLTFDKTGRIIVAESGENDIKVFLSAGKLLYRFGRKGAGPADLNGPCCIALHEAGRLWVGESQNYRYSVFSLRAAEPRYLWSTNFPANSTNERF